MSSALSPVDFPLGNSTLSKEHCKKVEKNIKIYCHFLPNTQSQTQAVTECLHCLLHSTGLIPIRLLWVQLVQKDITWCFSWWTECTWVHSPRRVSLGGPRQTPVWDTPESAPGHCHRGDEDRSSSAQHPPPTGHSELLWLKVFPLTVLLSSKATPWTASGREQAWVSTHARCPEGITLQVQSLPVRTGWPGRQNYFFSFSPSL